MTESSQVRILTGDECGLVKETLLPSTDSIQKGLAQTWIDTKAARVERIASQNYDEQSRRYAVKSLVPLSGISEDDDTECWRFAALREGKGGIVEMYESSSLNEFNVGSFHQISSMEGIFEANETGSCIGMGYSSSHNRLFASKSNGQLSVLPIHDMDDDFSLQQVSSRSKVLKNVQQNGDSITSFALSSDGFSAAFGGRDREIFVWDIEKSTVLFRGKNLPPDPQTLLQQKVWGTALRFIGNGIGQASSDDPCKILAVGSAYKELRIYDIRAQRRPISHMREGVLEHRVTSICQLNDTGTELAVGDAAGYIHNIDLRKMDAVGRFVGPGGSVRQIEKHGDMITCVSLDRILRTYNIKTRRLTSKIYLKQRLNCCIFAPKKVKTSDVPTEGWAEGEVDDRVQAYVDSSEGSSSESEEIGEEFRNSQSSSCDSHSSELNSDEDETSEEDSSSLSGGEFESRKKRRT